MNIVAISRCLGSDLEHSKKYNFHFKGFYLGEKIKLMSLFDSELCTVDKDYVLQIKVLKCESGILHGQIRRKKVLSKILIE